MVKIDANEWRVLAVNLLYPEAKRQKGLTRSLLEQEKDFRSDFGTSWVNVARIWELLHFPVVRIKERGKEPQHLLWALLYVKVYTNECITKKLLGRDPKTVRKWVWIFLEAIANLSSDVVSENFFFDIIQSYLTLLLFINESHRSYGKIER
jgi:hypothetical protein